MADAAPLARNPDLDSALSGSAGAKPVDFDALIAKQEETTKDFQAKTEDVEKSITEDVEKGHKATFDFAEAAKKAQAAFKEPPPVEKDRSPLEGFGSAASILATFGSLLTRRPLTNALNASAGVMNAYRGQDRDEFQRNMEAYKINIENAKTMYSLQSDAYNAIIADEKMSVQAKQASINAYAAAFKDETMLTLGTLKDQVQQVQFMDKTNQQLLQFGLKLDQFQEHAKYDMERLSLQNEVLDLRRQSAAATDANAKERIRIAQGNLDARMKTADKGVIYNDPEKKDAEGNPTSYILHPISQKAETFDGQPYQPSAAAHIASGASAGATLTADALAKEAETYRITGRMSALGQGGTGARIMIANMAAAQMKQMGISPAEQVAIQAEVKSDEGSLRNITRIADSAEAYERTALANMEIVKALLPAGVGSEYGPVLNRWIQTGKMELGSADVSKLTTALVTVANEYAKVMSGSTGAQGSTVDSRKEAAELLNAALAPDQILGNMDVMAADMENKKASYRGQRTEIEGRIAGSGGKPGAATSGKDHSELWK